MLLGSQDFGWRSKNSCLISQSDYDRSKQRGDRVYFAPQHQRHFRGQYVPQRSTANTGEHSQQRGWDRVELSCEGYGGACDSEDSQTCRIERGNEPTPFDDLAKIKEYYESCNYGCGEIAPIHQRRRGNMSEYYVPHYSTAKPRRYRQHQDPEQVHLLPNCKYSARQTERKSSYEVEYQHLVHFISHLQNAQCSAVSHNMNRIHRHDKGPAVENQTKGKIVSVPKFPRNHYRSL